MKKLWINDEGEFECKSCNAIAAYILDKTGLQAQVHKTERYIIFNYVFDSQLRTIKIDLPAGVLYCLEEKHLKPVLDAMLGAIDNG
jgi:hypothetical protein